MPTQDPTSLDALLQEVHMQFEQQSRIDDLLALSKKV